MKFYISDGIILTSEKNFFNPYNLKYSFCFLLTLPIRRSSHSNGPVASPSEDTTPVSPGSPDSANSLHQRQAAILHPAVSDVSQASGGAQQGPVVAAAQAGPSQARQPVGVSPSSPKK